MSDVTIKQENNGEKNLQKEQIKFIVNGEVVHFQDKPEVIKNILEDDEYAFLYLKKAQEEGKLTANDFNAKTPIFKFSRCPVEIESQNGSGDRSNLSFNSDSSSKNEIIWSHKYKGTERDIEATYDLLKIRSREYIIDAFENPKIKQFTIWEKISDMLSELGYNLGSTGPEKCRQKYINLRKTFYKYKRNLEQGKIAAAKPTPLFMDEMELLCRDKEFIPRKLTKDIIQITETENNISDTENHEKITENSENFMNVHDYLILTKDHEKSSSESDDNISLDESSTEKIIRTLKEVHEKQISFQQNLHDKLIIAIEENTQQTRKLNYLLEKFVSGLSKKRKWETDDDDER